ncbi:histidine phosphatase family protein [Tropicimonas sp. S265A]|uniref:histidine phosphatase family protein n=1 Tax=Tropicimonas sp. S265A TaxID=3415134 RepID=UPI003C7D005B
MQDWYWVRHGPTHAKTMIGWTDLPADLSDTAQIARVRDHLPGTAPLVSSDLSRAKDTAAAIAGDRVHDTISPTLREIHFGAWEARSHADVEAEARDHIFAFWDQPGDIAPPDGESWNTLRARVDGFVDSWRTPGPVVAVAHLGVIVSQIQRALSLPAREAFAYKIDNLSVTHLHRDAGDVWHVRTINHHP